MMLTQKYLRERLHYDPETGLFAWCQRPARRGHEWTDRMWNARYAGKRAGGIKRDYPGLTYIVIGLDGKLYKAHRLAWLYITGKFPPKGIDHDDGNGLNNRWKNLRLANQSQNIANRGAQRNNTTGFKGVSFYKRDGNYHAQIKVRGKRIHLGYFDTPEEGSAAYVSAAEKYFGEFARAAA